MVQSADKVERFRIVVPQSQADLDLLRKSAELSARLERLPNSRFNIMILAVGMIAFLVEGMDTSVVAAIIGPLKMALKLTPTETGTLSVAAVLTTVFGALIVGPLADLTGRKKMLIAGVLIAEVCTILTYFANSFTTFVLFRLLTGLGLGFIFPITLTYLAEFVGSKNRAYYTGICNSILGLGYFLTLLIGYVIVPFYGYHALFLVPGILLLFVPYLILVAPESPRWLVAHGHTAEADKVISNIEAKVARWTKKPLPAMREVRIAFDEIGKPGRIFSKEYLRTTIALWIMFSVTFMMFYTRLLYMPMILNLHRINLKHSLLYAAIMNAAAIPGNLLAGALMHYIGRRWAVAVYGIFTGIFVLAFSFAAAPWLLILLGSGIFWFDTFSAQKMLINESYPTGARGTGASAAEFVARFLGGVVWAGSVPILLSISGVHSLFILMGVAILFLVPVAGLSVKETRAAIL
ncbi:MFS transporter [Acidiphilium sp. AL]|uniref:MFS transporter n=1 Tax=Acidiphilium sp. AL TaxID=2871704 RepID=UPI0021CAE509|nr:MFS transporter [Acidiphilium sp. AL]MCU4161163.1 MFS transporter [Acidiphilium sp. AL]